MYRGIVSKGAKSLHPMHPHDNSLQRKHTPDTRHSDQVHERDKHCTNSVILVARQLSIGIFPLPDYFPLIVRETTGMNHGKQPHEKTRGQKKGKGEQGMKPGNSEDHKILKTIEPVTTVIDEGKFLRIVAELPGIAEEKIKIDLENHSTSVTILAVNTVSQFKRVITIPCEVRFSKKRFTDGVLELTLEKTNPASL